MTNEEVMRRIKDLQRTRGFGTMEAQRDFYALEVVAGAFLEMEKRGHGEWINKDYGIGKCWATCSECGESTNGEAQDHGFGYDYSFPNFCPNCGADMREGDEK